MGKKYFVEVITNMSQNFLSASDKLAIKIAVEEGVTAALLKYEVRDKLEGVVRNALIYWTAGFVKVGIVLTGVASFIYASTKVYQYATRVAGGSPAPGLTTCTCSCHHSSAQARNNFSPVATVYVPMGYSTAPQQTVAPVQPVVGSQCSTF